MFLSEQFKKSKQLVWRYLASSVSITLCVSGAWMQPARAEGSRDMFPSGAPGNRGHIIWSTGTSGGFKNRTLLRVYAEAGENILMGSSAVGQGSGNIQVYNPGTVTGKAANENLPSTANFTCTSQPGRGFIANRAEELAGAKSIDGTGNTAGYAPCFYQASTTGIYYVAIYGPSGSNSNVNPNSGIESNVEAINTGTNQNTSISAWDVTVRSSDDSSTADREGRLHTFFINMSMGTNGVQLHSDLYPITSDGYRYEIDMRGLDPFGFRIFGNQLGNLDSDGVSPLYKDVIGDNGDIKNPSGGTSSAPPQFPIFFNKIVGNSPVLALLPVYDPITGTQNGVGFPSLPTFPVVSDLSFAGDVAGNTSTVNTGGIFSFDANVAGVYQITISRDGVNFDPANPQNKVLRGLIRTSGTQSISWNGQDNKGEPFPVGSFDYGIEIHGGEYHFPISDAENNIFGGPTYTLLNSTNPLGNTIAFYDHRGYYTTNGTLVPDRDQGDGDPVDDALCGKNPPNPPVTNLFIGGDSSANNFNAFGQAANNGSNTNIRCTGSFGDTKTLDLWTYTPSSAVSSNLLIIDSADYGDAPDTGAGNGAGNYSTLAADNGPLHGTDGTLFMGGGVTDDSDGFVNGTDNNGNATDDVDDAFSNLPDATGGSVYDLNSILISNTTGADATLHAWIDFDQDGQFEESEYQSATVASGGTTADLSWNVPDNAVGGTSYARFRLTTDSLADDGDTAGVDERSIGAASDGEVEDYQVNVVVSSPSVVLAKRITAINRGMPGKEQPFDSTYVDVNTVGDNDPKWPGGAVPATNGIGTVESYISGITGIDDLTAIAGITTQPGDELEYTIPFLSNGDAIARDVLICDRIPTNTQFVADAFNSSPAAAISAAGNRGILFNFDGVKASLTNANDGDEVMDTNGNDNGVGGYYFPAGIDPSSELGVSISCGGANDNGVVVVDFSDVPNAVGEGDPANSYGFIRFRVFVD